MGVFDKLFAGPHLNVESPLSQTIAATDEMMEEDSFWNIIADTREGAADDYDRQQLLLERALRQLSPEEIILFSNRLKYFRGLANTWELKGASQIILDGCSDDNFIDFREWVIGQGKAFYFSTIENPASLVSTDVNRIKDVDLEGLGYVPEISFQDLTGEKLPSTYKESTEITGEKWSDSGNDLERMFPELSSKLLMGAEMK